MVLRKTCVFSAKRIGTMLLSNECNQLLKLSHEERRTSMMKKKLCLACGYSRYSKGSNDPKSHRCRSIAVDLKCDGDYNGSQCRFNGFTCRHRKWKASVKSQIKAKFNFDIQGGFNLAIIEEPVTVTLGNPSQVNIDYESWIEDLQLGEVAKNMDNNELRDFFQKRESLIGNFLGWGMFRKLFWCLLM